MLNLAPFKPKLDKAPFKMQPIDVVVLTRNSSDTIAYCLDTIRRNIEVAKLIVVDDSDDQGKTIQLASRWTHDIYIFHGNIGEKRNFALDLIQTESFAFVDSDVLVNRAAFLKSMEMLLHDDMVAAVSNPVVSADPRLRSVEKHRTRWSNLKFGFCLLRTPILKKCRIPLIPFGEDGRTGIKLRKLGYKWLAQNESYCWHLVTMQDNWFHGMRYARLGYPWISPKRVPLVIGQDLMGIVFASSVSRRRSLNNLVFCVFVTIGLLQRIASGGWPPSIW